MCTLLACDKCEVMLLKFSLEVNITHSVTSAAGQKRAVCYLSRDDLLTVVLVSCGKLTVCLSSEITFTLFNHSVE